MKVVTLGEIMLRLSPEGYLRFVQADRLNAVFGGGEANVAVSLANFGCQTAFVTKLPAHEIGQAAVNDLRRYGVGTSFILRGGERIGIYYLEKGASQRASKVIYDRGHSAFAESRAEEYDWGRIFEGADWFHFTGITPALGAGATEIVRAACMEAVARGVTVSCDLNYRQKLWSKEEARQVMSGLMEFVDVCICNEDDAANVFGIEAQNSDPAAGKLDKDAYVSVAKELMGRFNFRQVAITLRTSLSASDNLWAGMLYDGKAYFSKEYALHIVDRVGGGDSFSAGLIYALGMKHSTQEAVEFAAAASCLKHSVEGDYNHASAEEVMRLAGGQASGRVQR